MPLYHATAMVMGFAHTLSIGATFALGRKFSTRQFWPDVRKHGATIIQYVGESCRYLVNAPPQIDPVTGENLDKKHNVRIAFGNGLRPDVWNRFKSRFGIETIAEFFALTEGSFGAWNLSRNDFGAGAVGRHGSLYNLILGGNVAIVDFDHEKELPVRHPKTGFCHRVNPGSPGELLWRLPPNDIQSRFQGYYGDEEASQKKILRSVFRKGDAWLRTGDIMRKDSDNRLYFADRIGDTFRWKSENVSTAEVAEVMGLHPAVCELNVYGVQVPYHEGRAGCAAIVLNDTALDAQSGRPRADVLKSLATHVRLGLPKYALPLFLRFVHANRLEVTGTNKHPKNILRDQGITPEKIHPDYMFWLRNDTYVEFGSEAWKELNSGVIRL
jgi:acyl-CoA synthetase (AMP-forming)/AMP-acid ligase II